MNAGAQVTCIEPVAAPSATELSCTPLWVDDHCPILGRWPRRGEPWTPPEDERILALFAEGIRRYPNKRVGSMRGETAMRFVARSLGRTPCAVYTRYLSILACRRRGERVGRRGCSPPVMDCPTTNEGANDGA